MKLAVSFDMDSENIAPEFDSTMFFKMYDIEDGEILCSEVLSTMGKIGHEDLTQLLILMKADAMLCGNISEEACNALDDEGILFYSGFKGNADETAEDFINGLYRFE